MRFLIAIGVLLVFVQVSLQNQASSKLVKEYFHQHIKSKRECLAEVTDSTDVEAAYENTGEVIPDEHLGCFIKCVLIKDKVMTPSGDFSVEAIRANGIKLGLPDTELYYDELYNKCYANIDKMDLCNSVLKGSICFFEYAKL